MNRSSDVRRSAWMAILALAMLAMTAGCIPEDPDQSPSVPTSPAQPPTAPAQSQTQPTQGPSGSTSSFSSAARTGSQAPAAQVERNVAARVYEQDSQSVVNITSMALVPTGFGMAEEAPQGTGSGFVIDDEGHIVTNNHVVADAEELVVTFKDGTTMPAQLVGRDPDNDLAVIRVDPNGSDDQGRSVRDLLVPTELGDSDQIVIGEDAIAIGSPLGLEQTVTSGIVSAIRNPTDEAVSSQLELLGGAIQTDAAINPGNSGGPLFNAAGQVIGVNTAILSGTGGNIGIGFAIPVNVVKRVVPALIEDGCYVHPIVGVTTVSLSALGQSLKRELGIDQNQTGLLVQEVSDGAAQAGLRAGDRTVRLGFGTALRVGGDIITAVDGREIGGGGQLRAYIENNKRPGDTVTLTVIRNGDTQEVQVTLGQRPNDQCR